MGSVQNDSQAVGLGYQRRRLDARLDVRFEELEPTGTSVLVPYSEAGGSFQLLYLPGERLEFGAYANRSFGYSVDSQYSHYVGELYGLRARLKSQRGSLGVFAGLGEDEFVALAGGAGRLDDITEVGAQLDFQLTALSNLDMMLSVGGAAAFENGFAPRREFMVSFKLLR